MLKERLMKIINDRHHGISFLLAVFFFSIVCGFPARPVPASGEDGPGEKKSRFKGIRVVTDQAIMDSQARHTEFKGNVKLDIDDTEIQADWLKVNYRSGLDKDLKLSINKNSIKEIIARGNVRIMFDDKVAVTDEAVYIPETDTLVLTGKNSKISSGNDYITGDKIILNRSDGIFKVESTGKQRVEAVFYQEQPDQE